MDFLRRVVEDTSDKARFGYAVGKYVVKELQAPFLPLYYGVCTVCHDLRPHGFEQCPREDAWLLLEDIPVKKILQVRTLNPKSGLQERDCRYCRLICDIFDGFFIDQWFDWRNASSYTGLDASITLMIRQGWPLIINCLKFEYDRDVLYTRVDLEVYVPPDAEQASAEPSLPCMKHVVARDMDAGSRASMDFIRDAVRQCQQEHARCKQQSGFLPSRLLSLGESDEVLKVVEPRRDHPVSWAALSHCWGGEQPYRLLRDNVTCLKSHVDTGSLPVTFRDAIKACRQLDISFLWIDSLCIIQDDAQDWEREAATMGQVYGSAEVVLLAASSDSPSSTFLGPRSEQWATKSFQLDTKSGAIPILARRRHLLATNIKHGLHEPPLTDEWAYLNREGPLYRRAWCWQEAFMASRALHFAPGSIIFECKTHRRSQDQHPPYPSTIPGTIEPTGEMEQWHMIVKSFTSRRLTFGRDRLTAIGGAARKMPQAVQNSYLAGLWRQTLVLDLLWQIMPGIANRGRAITYDKDEQAAPSWSWASVSVGVAWDKLDSPQLLADILDANVILLGSDVFGRVAGGCITARARLLRCTLSANSNKAEFDVCYTRPNNVISSKRHVRVDGLLHPSPEGDPHHPWLYRKESEQDRKYQYEGSAYFMCLAKTSSMNYNYVGLIICPSRIDRTCFERIGKVVNMPRHWYDDGILQTVKLI